LKNLVIVPRCNIPSSRLARAVAKGD